MTTATLQQTNKKPTVYFKYFDKKKSHSQDIFPLICSLNGSVFDYQRQRRGQIQLILLFLWIEEIEGEKSLKSEW